MEKLRKSLKAYVIALVLFVALTFAGSAGEFYRIS